MVSLGISCILNLVMKASPADNFIEGLLLSTKLLTKRLLNIQSIIYQLRIPYCISQWSNLDSRIRNLPSIATFKRAILDFISSNPTPMFKINRLSCFVFLTRFRVGSVIYVNTNLVTVFWILLIPFVLIA